MHIHSESRARSFALSITIPWIEPAWAVLARTTVGTLFGLNNADVPTEDPVLSRAIDFWFLCREDEPVFCLETSGHAYSTKALTIELQREYAKGWSLYDVVAEIRTRFLTAPAHLSV